MRMVREKDVREVLLRIRLPDEIASVLKARDIEGELRLLIAIELYREGLISLGKAAEVAGLGIREFLYELGKRKVPLNYDAEELEVDLEALRELR